MPQERHQVHLCLPSRRVLGNSYARSSLHHWSWEYPYVYLCLNLLLRQARCYGVYARVGGILERKITRRRKACRRLLLWGIHFHILRPVVLAEGHSAFLEQVIKGNYQLLPVQRIPIPCNSPQSCCLVIYRIRAVVSDVRPQ